MSLQYVDRACKCLFLEVVGVALEGIQIETLLQLMKVAGGLGQHRLHPHLGTQTQLIPCLLVVGLVHEGSRCR
jgi:hypothetical protein